MDTHTVNMDTNVPSNTYFNDDTRSPSSYIPTNEFDFVTTKSTDETSSTLNLTGNSKLKLS